MESDLSLIEKVKNNSDADSLQLLIERHSGIYLNMINSVIPNSCDFLDKDDLIEDKNFSIYKAIMNYDENKNTKFSTYLGNETRWKCLNLFNRGTKYKYLDINDFNDDQNLSNDTVVQDISSKEMLDKVFNLADTHEDQRVKKIINLRYKVGNKNKTMPWKDISDKVIIEEIKKELQNVQ
jgi:DNA-directed RNA polymerase specialized sigma subunit